MIIHFNTYHIEGLYDKMYIFLNLQFLLVAFFSLASVKMIVKN
jgi:hypothetical protein